MHRRQPLPRLWLMTDERQGDALWIALERLPRGAGVVFRHYRLAPSERQRTFERVKAVARRKGLLLLLAGGPRGWKTDGIHGSSRPTSAPAHDLREIRAAERAGARLIFVSPVFATRSHPGARPLGRVRFGLLARQARLPVIALGGMNARRGRSLAPMRIHGWAAIDAWMDI